MLGVRILCVGSNSVVVPIDKLSRAAHYYAQTAKKQDDWGSVFLPNLQRNIAIKRFKENLSRTVECNFLPPNGSFEHEALDKLIKKTSGSKEIGNKSVREIYNLILQRRINDDEIYSIIAKISQNSVINVSVPKKLVVEQSVEGSKGNIEPFFTIHPEGEDHLSNVLNTIQEYKSSTLKLQSIETIGVPTNTITGSSKEALQTNIDIKSLRKYLQRAEKEEKQRKHYAWEKQKHYNWEERFSNSFKISPGRLFFADDKIIAKTRGWPNISKVFFNESSVASSQIYNDSKELLIYNLSEQSKHILPEGNKNSIFNINYKDLFGVINGSGYLPEEILPTINNFETAGWKLVGVLYDNSASLVFQRAVNTTRKNNEKWTKKRNLLWASIIALTGAASFKIFNKETPK